MGARDRGSILVGGICSWWGVSGGWWLGGEEDGLIGEGGRGD